MGQPICYTPTHFNGARCFPPPQTDASYAAGRKYPHTLSWNLIPLQTPEQRGRSPIGNDPKRSGNQIAYACKDKYV